MANYLAAAVVASGDVLGIYRDLDGALRLQWVNASDPDDLPMDFHRDDLRTVIKILEDAEAALSQSPTQKGGA